MSTLVTFTPESASFPSTNFAALAQDGQGRMYLAFDASTSESAAWTLVAPQGVTTPLSAVISYRAAAANTGTAQFDLDVEAITSADALDSSTSSSFDSVNSTAADTVPATAGHIKQLSVTLTNADSLAAADLVRIRIARNMSDTAAGDIQVLAVELRDAA